MGGDDQMVPLGEIVTFQSGNTPSKSNPDFWGGFHPWASAKDLKSFYINSTIDGLTDAGVANAAKVVGRGTTLLLTRGMTLVKHVPICVTTQNTAFNQDVKAVVPKKNRVEPELVPYLLLANERKIHDLVELAGHGTGKLPTESLLKFQVFLPGESKRKRIIELFSTLDDKIELNRAMNRTLEGMAQAIFKSWFVDFDPVKAKMAARESGADPTRAAMAVISGKNDTELDTFQQQDPNNYQRLHDTAQAFPDALVDSELGLIPEGWGVSTIGDEVTIVGGGTPSTKKPEFWDGGDIHWTTPKDLSNRQEKVLLDTDRCITAAGLAKISSGLLPVDTVLMSSRAPVGYLALAKIPVAVNQGYIAMKCEQSLPPEYVILWADSIMDEIKGRASGTTFAEISKKNFRIIPVVVPSENVLSRFSDIVGEYFQHVTKNVWENEVLAHSRDTLLPKLLSGEVDFDSTRS